MPDLSTTRIRTPGQSKSSFRADVQGLRAVAVLLVMLWHAGVPTLPGGYVGVDVFFVLSGFLMTGLLLRDLERDDRISLVAFYARRARRLLPAALVVVLSVLALTRFALPETRWTGAAGDALAALLFSMNWRLLFQAVDYLYAYVPPSPLQHFWSLGVEEQFYLVWPLYLAVLWWAARRWGRRPGRVVLGGMVLATVLSLAFSVVSTELYPSRAYFATPARVWEMSVGALLAMAAPSLARLPRRAAAAAGWAGLAGIVVSAVLFTRATPFPGYWALLPVLSTALVIGVGPAAGSAGPERLLRLPPLVRIGDWSYSLYLWHWPLILVASAWVGGSSAISGTLPPGLGLLVVAASFVPAYATYRWVEEPFRRTGRRDPSHRAPRALAVAGGALVASVGAAALFVVTLPAVPPLGSSVPGPPLAARLGTATAPVAATTPLGAEVLRPDPRDDPAGAPVDRVDRIVPDPRVAAADEPDCPLTSVEGTDLEPCTYGDPASPTHVVLVGDSHLQQWLPAVRSVAVRRGWRVTAYLHASCPFVEVEVHEAGVPYRACNTWNAKVRDRLAELTPAPAAVVTSHYTPTLQLAPGADPLDGAVDALRQAWTSLAARSPVVVLRDTPDVGLLVPECVLLHEDDLSACSVPRSSVQDTGRAQVLAARGLPGVTLVDLVDAVCPTDRCAPVIGGVLVYRDQNHLSATYSATLAGHLDPLLAPVVAGNESSGR